MANIATVKVAEELRPAMYRAGNRLAGFHEEKCLVHVSKQGPHYGFVCETEDGYLLELQHDDFRFTDSKGRFDEICWEVDE